MTTTTTAGSRRSSAAGSLVLAVALGACGGSAVTRDQYAERVEGICREYLAYLDDYVEPSIGRYFEALGDLAYGDYGLQGFYAMLEGFDDAVVADRQDIMFADIAALTPPEEGAGEFADHFARVREAFDAERAAIAAAADDPARARQLWESADSPHLDFDHEAILLGIPACRFG